MYSESFLSPFSLSLQQDVKSIFKLVDVDRSGWVSRSVSFPKKVVVIILSVKKGHQLFILCDVNKTIVTMKEARMAAKLLKKRFNIQNVNDWLKENDENMDGKLKYLTIFSYGRKYGWKANISYYFLFSFPPQSLNQSSLQCKDSLIGNRGQPPLCINQTISFDKSNDDIDWFALRKIDVQGVLQIAHGDPGTQRAGRRWFRGGVDLLQESEEREWGGNWCAQKRTSCGM